MNPSDSAAELSDLCDRLLDGEFTAADRDRLEALVLENPDRRRLYVERMQLHASLRQQASRVADVPLSEVLGAMPDEEDSGGMRFPNWPMQMAAGIAIGLAVWLFSTQTADKGLATIIETNGARWENSSLPTAPGSELAAGKLRLADGVARIRFQSGAEVSLEGPAELEITGGNACFLYTGALVAHVPEQARGFAVGTVNAKLIDHGTDFGISTDRSGRAQVQVMQGEVELQHDRSGETLRLLTKESVGVTAERFAPNARTEAEPDRYAFLRSEKAERPELLITSAGGKGDAAYVVSPNSPIHASDTLLLLKNAPTKSFLRRAYVRFDLAPVQSRKVADATLMLNFEATGFGYASLTGDCTFAVYGLTAEAEDQWSGDTISWESAPAFAEDAGSVDLAKAVKLGTFIMPRGVMSGAYGISGPSLAAFLNSDANRLATLIIVRETSEPKPNGAVHGFAGNRHPTLAPPTLRLILTP
jgi:ferric-dicitrate binding protein FerR (iron transport regulator)